jgi:hypothetical protein
VSAPILQPGDHIHVQIAVSPRLTTPEEITEEAGKVYLSLVQMYNRLGVWIPTYTVTNAPGAEMKIVSVVRGASAKDAINE